MYEKKKAASLCGLKALFDSDVFFILVYHASRLKVFTVLFETAYGNKKRCLDIDEFVDSFKPALRSSLLSLYAFGGCDSCSAFKGKRNVAPIKLLKKSVHFKEVFGKLGESQEVPSDVPGVLEEFMSAMYGNARVKCVNDTLGCWLSVVPKGEAD